MDVVLGTDDAVAAKDRLYRALDGIVSEENLNLLRSRGASYLVATPKRLLTQFQKELLAEDWTQVANHPQIQVKRIERDGGLYVLTRSLARAEQERAMRQRVLKGLRKE
jgi:hypothetical protein